MGAESSAFLVRVSSRDPPSDLLNAAISRYKLFKGCTCAQNLAMCEICIVLANLDIFISEIDLAIYFLLGPHLASFGASTDVG